MNLIRVGKFTYDLDMLVRCIEKEEESPSESLTIEDQGVFHGMAKQPPPPIVKVPAVELQFLGLDHPMRLSGHDARVFLEIISRIATTYGVTEEGLPPVSSGGKDVD